MNDPFIDKNKKNFHFKILPGDVLFDVLGMGDDDRLAYYDQFFKDLHNDDAEKAKIPLASKIINEANTFRASRVAGGKNRWRK